MIKLGEQEFHVPPPGGMESFALQQRIVPVAARIIGVFARLAGVDLSKGWDKLELEDILPLLPQALPALGDVFAHMPPGELEGITKVLLKHATCGKLPLFGSQAGDAFDGLMAGRTLDTWKLLWHALSVWYPDFFGGARVLAERRAARAKSSETSATSSPNGQEDDSSPKAG